MLIPRYIILLTSDQVFVLFSSQQQKPSAYTRYVISKKSPIVVLSILLIIRFYHNSVLITNYYSSQAYSSIIILLTANLYQIRYWYVSSEQQKPLNHQHIPDTSICTEDSYFQYVHHCKYVYKRSIVKCKLLQSQP